MVDETGDIFRFAEGGNDESQLAQLGRRHPGLSFRPLGLVSRRNIRWIEYD